MKPYIECTKVETECALLAGSGGGGNAGGYERGSKSNPFSNEAEEGSGEEPYQYQ
ncbi:hypothetical protein KZO58_07730 [Prevotella histicola]|uniref:hypothetical protein n=1 Tax=Prevotella histicola TaxID=470565 RepID=UPI001C5F2381|nr:hypothetical protein [Prevotella histicola]MBW4739410.1 hypothetical protein [Prevotella histicola]MBW4747621.1 hypothetical protein [Prevotella histicola]